MKTAGGNLLLTLYEDVQRCGQVWAVGCSRGRWVDACPDERIDDWREADARLHQLSLLCAPRSRSRAAWLRAHISGGGGTCAEDVHAAQVWACLVGWTSVHVRPRPAGS